MILELHLRCTIRRKIMEKNDNRIRHPIVETDKRDFYLGFLDDAINKLHHKATKGKIKNPKNEKIKIEYFRALVYAISTANSVLEKKQLDKLERDLEMLKEGIVFQNEEKSSELDEDKLKEIERIDAKIDKMLGGE